MGQAPYTHPMATLLHGTWVLGILALLTMSLSGREVLPDPDPYRYREYELQGWNVHVQKELDRKKDLREDVLALLRTELWEIRTRLPEKVVARLQEVPLRFHLDREGCPGGVYHPSAQWLREHDLPEVWAEGVEFGNAENFLSWSRQQPDMVLHELAHAWHHQVLTYEHEGIRKAYAAVKESGQLQDIVYVMGGRQVAYALNNEMEFFAEMSEAWWGVNDMYPFVRGEVLEDFAEVGKLLEACWRIPKD